MSTMSIHKMANEKLTVSIENVPTDFIVNRVAIKQFKRFEINNVLFIPAFDESKIFKGWAEITPAPKTVQDLSELGYDLFESAFSAVAIKIQQKIRSTGDGKSTIDKQLAELTKQFALGTIDAEQLRAKVLALQGTGVVQIVS